MEIPTWNRKDLRSHYTLHHVSTDLQRMDMIRSLCAMKDARARFFARPRTAPGSSIPRAASLHSSSRSSRARDDSDDKRQHASSTHPRWKGPWRQQVAKPQTVRNISQHASVRSRQFDFVIQANTRKGRSRHESWFSKRGQLGRSTGAAAPACVERAPRSLVGRGTDTNGRASAYVFVGMRADLVVGSGCRDWLVLYWNSN